AKGAETGGNVLGRRGSCRGRFLWGHRPFSARLPHPGENLGHADEARPRSYRGLPGQRGQPIRFAGVSWYPTDFSMTRLPRLKGKEIIRPSTSRLYGGSDSRQLCRSEASGWTDHGSPATFQRNNWPG